MHNSDCSVYIAYELGLINVSCFMNSIFNVECKMQNAQLQNVVYIAYELGLINVECTMQMQCVMFHENASCTSFS